MKKYGQFCPIALALDRLGDRWTLLILRDLLSEGPKRYSDLVRNLPGIGTNLLAERLKELLALGLVIKEKLPSPFRAEVYKATEQAQGLIPVMRSLAAWGRDLMPAELPPEFVSKFQDMASRVPGMPWKEPEVYELKVGKTTFHIIAGPGGMEVLPGPAKNPDLRLRCEPPTLVDLFLLGDDSTLEKPEVQINGSPEARRHFLQVATAGALVCDEPQPQMLKKSKRVVAPA